MSKNIYVFRVIFSTEQAHTNKRLMEIPDMIIADREIQYDKKHIAEIYEQAFPHVAKFVRNMGGALDDAKDIFHDALVIYFGMISESNTKIYVSEEAYILGIAKHLWMRKFNRKRSHVPLNDMETGISIPDDYFPTVNNKRLLRFLEITGKKCMDLLRAFYYQHLAVKDLVKALGYTNEHSASVQKYKCLEKLRNTVKEKSLSYEDFIE